MHEYEQTRITYVTYILKTIARHKSQVDVNRMTRFNHDHIQIV